MSFLFCIFAVPSYSRLARCDVQSGKVTAVSKCAKPLSCDALLDQFNKKPAKRIARDSVWAISEHLDPSSLQLTLAAAATLYVQL